jgi:hypothetical protein
LVKQANNKPESLSHVQSSCAQGIYLGKNSQLIGASFLDEKLEETKEAIKKKGAKWKADKTSMSKLSRDERRKRLGLVPNEEELERIRKAYEKKEK